VIGARELEALVERVVRRVVREEIDAYARRAGASAPAADDDADVAALASESARRARAKRGAR
jgi:hypothetical protein